MKTCTICTIGSEVLNPNLFLPLAYTSQTVLEQKNAMECLARLAVLPPTHVFVVAYHCFNVTFWSALFKKNPGISCFLVKLKTLHLYAFVICFAVSNVIRKFDSMDVQDLRELILF